MYFDAQIGSSEKSELIKDLNLYLDVNRSKKT